MKLYTSASCVPAVVGNGSMLFNIAQVTTNNTVRITSCLGRREPQTGNPMSITWVYYKGRDCAGRMLNLSNQSALTKRETNTALIFYLVIYRK